MFTDLHMICIPAMMPPWSWYFSCVVEFFSKHFTEKFYIYVHQGYWTITFIFLKCVFTWFWY
jgi:hypothetical protein